MRIFGILKNQCNRYIFFLSVLLSCLPANAQVITWQGPKGFESDKYYSLKVNGIRVPVYDTPIASYALFDFTGKAEVEVHSMFDIRWVDIRPLRTGLQPEYTGDNSFRFSMDKPENLSLELNGRIRQQPLFLFGAKPEDQIPAMDDSSVIRFRAGMLYTGVKLELQDNQTVYIEGGAVVQGYIYAKGKKNITITGRGILDGSMNREDPENHNRFIKLEDCENIIIRGITLHNGTTWQTALFHCNHALIEDIKIVSENGGDDGIDIFRCTNVEVRRVFAHTKDDCIAIKSGGKYPAGDPTDNIIVKECTFWNSIWGNAIEVGFELYSDEVKNIRFENIDVIHVEDGATMSIHNAGPSHVYNVVFDNIRVEDSRQKLIDVAIFFSRWGPDGIDDKKFTDKYYLHGAWDGVYKIPEDQEEYHAQFRGRISGIEFRNIQVTGGLLPFSVFHGFDEKRNVSDIRITNLSYMGKKIMTASEARIRTQNTKNLTIQ